MISRWTGKLQTLIWLRLVSALIMVFLLYWYMTDFEVKNRWIELTPMAYFWGGDEGRVAKKISGLIMPIFANIALWIPRYRSYIFLKVVLYAERIKLIITIGIFLLALVIGFPLSIFMLFNIAIIVIVLAFILNCIMINSLKKQSVKEYFHVDKLEQCTKNSTIKMGIMVCAIFVAVSIAAYYLQIDVPKYASTEIRYINNTNSEFSLGGTLKMSEDEKMFVIRRPGENELTTTTIFDAVNMNPIKKMYIPVDKYTPYYTYSFTPDSKYIVIAAGTKTEEKISFHVYNISTGKRDDRFIDSQHLLDNIHSKYRYNNKAKFIKFNHTGNYFIVGSMSGDLLEVWDYKNGVLIYGEKMPQSIKETTVSWVTEKKFLLAYPEELNSVNRLVYEYEILENNSIRKVKKEQLSKGISQNTRWPNINVSYDGQYVVSATYDTGVFFNASTINVWEVGSEKKVFTTTRTGVVKDIAFHPDCQRIAVLERTSSGENKVTLWSIATGKKERDIYLPPFHENKYKYFSSISILKDGQRIMLMGEAIYFVSLEQYS